MAAALFHVDRLDLRSVAHGGKYSPSGICQEEYRRSTRTNAGPASFFDQSRMVIMNRRVFALGLAVEVLASVFSVAALAPFRYPVTIGYLVVEHVLLWGITFGLLIKPLARTLESRLSNGQQTAVTCVFAELVSTSVMWFVIPSFDGFWDYIFECSFAWFVLGAIAALVYLFMPSTARIPSY